MQHRAVGIALLVLGGAVCALAALPAAAQTAPAPSRVTPETLRPPPVAAPVIELPSAAGLTPPANAAQLSVTVGRIDVDGTFPEFASETGALLNLARGKRMTVAEIYALGGALEHAYAAAGYILARVAIPPQKLVDGATVRFVVIDGTIERIDAANVPERVRGPVLARMARLIGKPYVTLGDIERGLLLVSDLPGLQLRSTLAAGSTPGGTLLILEATQNYVTGSVGFDDRLPASLGTWSLNSNVAVNDVLGFSEQIYASVQSSPDFDNPRLRVFGGGIVAPIGGNGFTLNPEYTNSFSEPIPAPGAPPTEGNFQRAALRANYPVIRTRAQTLTLQAAIEWDDETLAPIGFATDLYHNSYAAARFQATDNFYLPWGASASISGTFSQGLAGRDGTTAVPLS